MRQYKKNVKEIKETEKIICNMCGREIEVNEGVPAEDVLEVRKRWGYFSAKDNRRDSFELCEDCYDKLVESFLVPVETESEN